MVMLSAVTKCGCWRTLAGTQWNVSTRQHIQGTESGGGSNDGTARCRWISNSIVVGDFGPAAFRCGLARQERRSGKRDGGAATLDVITVFPDAEANGRRDQLWDRDVAEVFLQPDPSQLRRYKEFEVSPNGFWIDLDIAPGEKRDLKSGMRRRVSLSEAKKTWVAEIALPMKCLVERFDSAAVWKVNFYRVEGAAEPRFYSAWQATRTAAPNFHVPEAFGELIFGSGVMPRE